MHCQISPTDSEAHNANLAIPFEASECVADEGQAHLGRLVAAATLETLALADHVARVLLRDLVDGEVGRVDLRRQLGLEGRADAAQRGPVDAAEERVRLDLERAACRAETVWGVADEAVEGK